MQRTTILSVALLLITGTISAGWFHSTSDISLFEPPVLCSTVVTNTGDSGIPGSGSLRAALICANSNPGPDTVSFNIPLSDPGFSGTVFEIRPLSGLAALMDNGTTIDGATQTAFTGDTNAAGPEVVINGSLMGFSFPQGGGLHVFSSANRIHSLVINGFTNFGTGILITGPNANGNLVTGCYIGTNDTGTAANPNSLEGVAISSGASNNVVGGTTPQERNVLSGNIRHGVLVFGIGGNPSNNVIKGNFIGTDASGLAAVGNSMGVVFVTANSNIVGGTAAGAGNVISGNIGEGIHSNSSSNQTIQGNYIGTDVTGTAAIPNGFHGINMFTGASPSANNLIGGSVPGAGNLISGNTSNGISIGGTGSDNNVIQGNMIGTDSSGNAALGNQLSGIGIGTSGNLIGGTSIGSRNLVSGNGLFGVAIFGGTGNQVQGNYVGTNTSGMAAIGNGGNGVVLNNAPNNTIGGTLPGAGNLISGNAAFGVNIGGLTATGNQVQGNLIGTDATGNAAIPNGAGVNVNNSGNTIGGTSTAARNVVSGNAGPGIRLITPRATLNTVQGNYVGTNMSGSSALGNGLNGIVMNLGASNNLIGGTSPGAGNVASGNGSSGVYCLAAGTSFNRIQGNFVGTNASGTSAIPNQHDGIRFDSGAMDNLAGGTAPGERNIVSGNLAHGVHIDGFPLTVGGPGSGTARNTVQGNLVGTDVSGTNAIGNRLAGVIVFGGASDNLIGGTDPGAGNMVAFTTGGTSNEGATPFVSPGAGISVANDGWAAGDAGGQNSLRNRISRNSVFSNNGIGIDLSDRASGPDPTQGPSTNDACDADSGPNAYQNFPVLTSVSLSGTTATVQGTFNSAPNETYTLEFFSSSAGDPSGSGEGQTYLGSTTVTTGADCNAAFTFTATLPTGQTFVTATATDADGNTSEFSPARSVFEYLAGGGSFVIGDQNAAVGSQVTFWGSQWSSLNQLSGGSAPSAFKGFADTTSTSPANCGGTWATRPGNSSNPPASVPEYMAVVVASSAAKSGSTIGGNISRIVVVRTDPGYAGNPGHAGTGQVVGVVCQ